LVAEIVPHRFALPVRLIAEQGRSYDQALVAEIVPHRFALPVRLIAEQGRSHVQANIPTVGMLKF